MRLSSLPLTQIRKLVDRRNIIDSHAFCPLFDGNCITTELDNDDGNNDNRAGNGDDDESAGNCDDDGNDNDNIVDEKG